MIFRRINLILYITQSLANFDNQNLHLKNILYFIITSLIWGSTWLVITFQLGVVDPLISVVYRYLLASLLLFLFCLMTKRNLKYSLVDHLFMLLLGIFLFGFNYWFTYEAELHITSGLVALVFSSIVFFNIINNTLILKAKLNKKVLFGAILGFIGILLVFNNEIINFDLKSNNTKGFVLAFSGAFIASLGNITSARNQRNNIPVIQANTFGMLYGALIMLITALITGSKISFDPSFPYIASLFYLSIFGSIIAFSTYLILLGNIGPDRAGYVTLVFPIIALILSTIFENYQWSEIATIGIFLVLIGNIIVLRMKKTA